MSESNRTYRIRTDVGVNQNMFVNLEQDYKTFEILSLRLSDIESYRLHDANYGIIVGRVIANNGFGVENAKISVFISSTAETASNSVNSALISQIYPFSGTSDKDKNGVRYNTLSDEKINDCHQVVGTFPNKTFLLDNDVYLEVFDTYYKYTARTNHAGDYLIPGVPVGEHTLHMDLDISDCGILSQRPRDMVYKGYTIEQFMNPNQFKTGTDLDSLSQIFMQETVVNVNPFWGATDNGTTLGITRADFNVPYKFEPTAIFMGCIVGDNASNGITHRCIATENAGAMDELVTGEGTIEMIRKTPSGDVEEFQVKGTQVINGNGVWCYQIPMNLDYVTHDEYGNIVPTNNPEKGIPTRSRVRFRISMNDFETNTDNFFRAKVLVPHNPQNKGEVDYSFGTTTKEDSFRDLLWNNVYTVKSYIPRFQKSQNFKDEKFTGIKHCNIYGQNNPMPYNNIRIKLPFMYVIMCALIKTYVRIIGFVNKVIWVLAWLYEDISRALGWLGISVRHNIDRLRYVVMGDGLCPDLENWYFAPFGNCGDIGWKNLCENTLNNIIKDEDYPELSEASKDRSSIDNDNSLEEDSVCLTNSVEYLLSCIEMNLAQEYRVINFDFYNDWINGCVYMPRWMRFVRNKRSFLFGLIKIKGSIKGCMSADSDGLDPSGESGVKIRGFLQTMKYTQQCSLGYRLDNNAVPTLLGTPAGCDHDYWRSKNRQLCHKKTGLGRRFIFGSENGGIVHSFKNLKEQFIYYFKPCEWDGVKGRKVNLFANDLVLLGSLNDCSDYGLPQAFKWLSSSTYKMPTNLALTNMEDNGYLYARNDDDTICHGNKNFDIERNQKGIKRIGGTGETFSTIQKANSEKETWEQIVYDEGEDYVPMTVSAGISWDFNGPDQGDDVIFDKGNQDEINPEPGKIYQPGGHFLGLSCTNAQTNVKSCLNLERICEAGVTMSQRHEILKSRQSNGDLHYSYLVPTGVISNDEIMGGDFRTMFASMNKNRLICDKFNPSTGYKEYSFIYSRPNAFDGFLNEIVDNTHPTFDETLDIYNMRMKNARDFVVEPESKLKEIGITPDPLEMKDITDNTMRRTIESKNKDYYMFRLGIDDLSVGTQEKKYYGGEGEWGHNLPQYENSFYFYFGLTHGATALDELYKQFFSTCGSGDIDNSESRKEMLEVGGSSSMSFEYNETGELVKQYAYVQNANGVRLQLSDATLSGDTNKFVLEIENNTAYVYPNSENKSGKAYNATLILVVNTANGERTFEVPIVQSVYSEPVKETVDIKFINQYSTPTYSGREIKVINNDNKQTIAVIETGNKQTLTIKVGTSITVKAVPNTLGDFALNGQSVMYGVDE